MYKSSNPNGQATATNSEPVVIASDQSALPIAASDGIGGLTEAAPASDTASSGLNGRLQRIAQRLTSLIALLPTALGQTTKAGSLSVALASDQDALPITDNAGSLTVDNAGTFAVQAASAGDVAHDGADSGNPIKIGFQAIAHGANPTAVAAADRSNSYANRHGIPFMLGGHPNIVSAEYVTAAAATDDNIMIAISAGTKYVITSITVSASAANTNNTSVRIGFGATTVPTQGASQADAVSKVILSHPGIAPGSGIVKGNGSGIVGIGGDGEELRITCGTPGGSIVVQVDYFTIES